MIGNMTQWSPRRWLRWSTVLVVAWGVFAVLHWAQISHQAPTTQWGTINPDASVEEVINHIQALPDSPVFKPDQEETQEDRDVKKPEDIEDKNQEEVDLEAMVGDLLSTGSTDSHDITSINYQDKLTSLCQTYPWSCDITSLDGSYAPQQKFAYQLMVVYVINKLEEFGYDPLASLRSLTINNYTKNKRWYANAKIMVINTYQIASYKEFLQVLAHEMWHVVDLGVVRGTSPQINPDYTEFGKAKFAVDDQSLAFYAISWANENTLRSRMTSEDFVSGYGMSNPFEDFAECHNMYLYHRDVFEYMATSSKVLQEKYAYFDRMYQTQKLSANFNPTDLTTLDVGFRPWDSTRM